MTNNMSEINGQETKERREALSLGIVFVAVGAGLLLAQLVEVYSLLFLFIAAVMVALGIVQRSAGWFIPGGILAGLGAGIVLIEDTALVSRSVDEGAIFLLALAGGFALITVLTALFARRSMLWPLIPASIMGLISGGILTGGVGLVVLEFVGRLWPVALIIAGAIIVAKALVGRQDQ